MSLHCRTFCCSLPPVCWHCGSRAIWLPHSSWRAMPLPSPPHTWCLRVGQFEGPLNRSRLFLLLPPAASCYQLLLLPPAGRHCHEPIWCHTRQVASHMPCGSIPLRMHCRSDETILPTDYKTAGQIVDDELNLLLVKPLLPGVTLHTLIDACHSGTALDLPYRIKANTSGRLAWKVGVGGVCSV